MTMSTGESILIAVLTFLMITDIVGNTLVCIVVLRNRSLKTPMNYILVNLAIADMTVALFMAPRHIFLSAFTHPNGETGDYICKFLTGGNFMWVGGAASSFCLVAIAVERYYAILYPHMDKGRITRKKLKIIIISCWVYAIAVDIPPFLVINYNEKRQFCTEYWPDINYAKAYTVLMFNLDFAIPVLLMGILYSRVAYNLWFQRQNMANVTQMAVFKSRKKVTKMVLIVTAIYGMSWMPVLTLYLLSYHLPSQFRYASIFHNAAIVFICINSSINPFIYSFQMRGFKSEIKRLFTYRKMTRVQDIRGMSTSTHYGTSSMLQGGTTVDTHMKVGSMMSIREPISNVRSETNQAANLNVTHM